MYSIVYNNKFIANAYFEGSVDHDTFMEEVNFLKIRFFTYDGKSKGFIVPDNRIQELVLWFKKFNKIFFFSEEASEKYNKIIDKPLNIKFNRRLQIDFSKYLKEGVELYDFQKEGVKLLLSKNRGYLADEPGLGKSVESITAFSFLHANNLIDGIFLVVKNNLQQHWKREILSKSSIFVEDDIKIVDRKSFKDLFKTSQDYKILILSSDIVGDVFASYHKNYSTMKSLAEFRWKVMVDIKKDWGKNSICLIIDEAHEFKNVKAIKTKALNAHKRFFDYSYLLSATPAINYFEDFWSGMSLLDEGIISMPYNAFKIDISTKIGEGKYGIYNIEEYNPDKIHEYKQKFNFYVIKRLKSELPEMKAKQIIKPVYLKMSGKQEHIYQSVVSEILYKLENEYDYIQADHLPFKSIYNKFSYVIQAVDNIELLKGKITSESNIYNKINAWSIEDDVRFTYLKQELKEYIEDFEKKIIIFDPHPTTLNSLAEKFKKYNPLVIHGQEDKDTKNERQYKIDQFNDIDSDNRLLLISSYIGGVGFNLHYACHRCISWSLPYDTTLYRQLIDRIYRITSTEDAIVENLLLDNTIDLIRYELNTGRLLLNDNLFKKEVTPEYLKNLFLGRIGSK